MIIDTHVHTGIFEDIDRIVNMSEEIVLEAMGLYHIDMAVVSNAAVEFDCEWNPVPMEKQISQEASFLSAIEFACGNTYCRNKEAYEDIMYKNAMRIFKINLKE